MLIKAHVITAILLWIFIVIAGVITLDEGGLVGMASLCLIGVVTFITAVDISSVYFIKKEKSGLGLPIISIVFWGLVVMTYVMALFSPNQPWQSKSVSGVIVATALFKIFASVSLLRKESEVG